MIEKQIRDAVAKFYDGDNYIHVIVKEKNMMTSGFYLVEGNTIEYANATVDIFKALDELIRSPDIEIGITLLYKNGLEVEKHHNPELFTHDKIDLIIYQKYGLIPKKEEKYQTLQESIKKERIKNTLVYSCYIDDRPAILERAKTAKRSQLEKKLQYTGTPLGLCAEHDFLEGFKLIAECGANVTNVSLGSNPIQIAFYHSEDIVWYLYEFHRESFVKEVHKRGFIMAKSCRNLKILQLLLDIGADVVGKNKSFPTLHNFADAQNINGMKFILDQGFDINYKNKNGQTALDRAMVGSKPETVEFLLQHGAKKGSEI